MQPKLVLPDPRFRSPTAVGGKSDFRDEHIYSALVLADGGAGIQKVFTIPQGQSIPELKGSGKTATANSHQTTFTESTTNLTKAGELGSAIGDAALRAIGVTCEGASIVLTSGAPRAFGMTQFEVNDVLSKSFFILRIANKPQIIGPIFAFPCSGAAFGSVSTTGTAQTASVVNNGWPGALRRLKIPIPVARNDTLEGVYGVAGGASLAFNAGQGADGQPSLLWFNLYANVAGDVR